jgi:hypothetical protein
MVTGVFSRRNLVSRRMRVTHAWFWRTVSVRNEGNGMRQRAGAKSRPVEYESR